MKPLRSLLALLLLAACANTPAVPEAGRELRGVTFIDHVAGASFACREDDTLWTLAFGPPAAAAVNMVDSRTGETVTLSIGPNDRMVASDGSARSWFRAEGDGLAYGPVAQRPPVICRRS